MLENMRRFDTLMVATLTGLGFALFAGAAPDQVLAQSVQSTEYGDEGGPSADTADAAQPADGKKQMRAVRIQDGTPSIDGRLDDPSWASANWVSDFVMKEPNEFAEPTLRTEVAFLFDENALYVGARMESGSRAEIGNLMTRRDEAGNAERLIVSLDTYYDQRTAYSFAVTAAGVRLDWFHPSDNEFERDETFNPVWTAKTRINDDGWTAEMRIPFSQLRFSGGENQLWGVNLNRFIPSRNEDDFWVVVPRSERAWSSRFGELIGIASLPSTRRIELAPYIASDATLKSDALIDKDDPFSDAKDLTGRLGLDFKMGLGPSLTLDATVNPDFGQVEADPAEVNLSAFETFFEERRPFFTEGQQAFRSEGPTFYYSRRIGAPPHGETDGDFDDTPNVTTILTAAKVTGQTNGGLTIGALAAVTDDESAREFSLDDGTTRDVGVEPRTTYGILRLQQQIGADQSTLGGTFTVVRRNVDKGSALAEVVAREAYAGGIDWNKRFNGGAYELLGHAGFSHVAGDAAYIKDLQESSRHYFQRPDAGHVDVDETATTMEGWSAALRGGKRNGKWRWDHGVWLESPGFEINDAGRLGRADGIDSWGNISYRETTPGERFRNWQVGAWTNQGWNFDGVHTNTNLGMWTNATWKNFWNTNFELMRGFSAQSDDNTRGGPLMQRPQFWWSRFDVRSNFADRTRWTLQLEGVSDELGGWRYQVGASLSTQPNDRLTLSVEPRYRRHTNARQYIDTFDDAGGGEQTFGSRYVFGRVARSEIAMPLRTTYSFSPDLSLELYAEPFASSGRYSEIGELAAARTSDLRLFGEADGTSLERDENGDFTVRDGADTFEFENPDFDALSFRSNLVMRWEWSPGSTLFVVWQQNRSQDDSRGRFVGPGSLLDSFSSDGDNVLAVKFAYWLPI